MCLKRLCKHLGSMRMLCVICMSYLIMYEILISSHVHVDTSFFTVCVFDCVLHISLCTQPIHALGPMLRT